MLWHPVGFPVLPLTIMAAGLGLGVKEGERCTPRFPLLAVTILMLNKVTVRSGVQEALVIGVCPECVAECRSTASSIAEWRAPMWTSPVVSWVPPTKPRFPSPGSGRGSAAYSVLPKGN